MVKILFPSLLSEVINTKKLEVSAKTLGEVIETLVKRYGTPLKEMLFEESGELNRYLKIYIKGHNILEFDMETPLNENDEVVIFVVISGG